MLLRKTWPPLSQNQEEKLLSGFLNVGVPVSNIFHKNLTQACNYPH